MKLKRLLTALLAMAMVIGVSMTSLANGWIQDNAGWWYSTSTDNSTYYANGWYWIDGNGDEIAECYCFDENGYMLADTLTPDGCLVNADGQWIDILGVVQTQTVSTPASGTRVSTSSGGSSGGGGGGSSKKSSSSSSFSSTSSSTSPSSSGTATSSNASTGSSSSNPTVYGDEIDSVEMSRRNEFDDISAVYGHKWYLKEGSTVNYDVYLECELTDLELNGWGYLTIDIYSDGKKIDSIDVELYGRGYVYADLTDSDGNLVHMYNDSTSGTLDFPVNGTTYSFIRDTRV